MSRSRAARPFTMITLVAAVVAGVLSGGPAAAARQQAQQEQQEQPLAPVMMVLDASGSMTAADPGGGTKMDAAKAAVRGLVEQTPTNAQLGLTVYGTGTGNSEAEKAAGCQDVQVVHDVGALDRAGVVRAADAIQPSGYTPIGRSLQVAAEALPQEGPRSIVLVSDGIDTCAPPDPCEIARQLAQQGVELSVHVVGFDLDDAARQQLTCVAEATGGTYTDAADADELGPALSTVTATALRGYEAVGTPIQGGADQASAPAVQPGAYLDEIDPGEALYYTVDLQPGFTLYATATIVLPAGDDSDRIQVEVRGADGSKCGTWDSDSRLTGEPMATTVRDFTLEEDATAQEEDPCERPGTFGVRVERSLRDGSGGTVPLELLIGLEPPLAGATGPSPASEEVTFTAPAGEPVPVVGGGSFSTAGTLEGSGRYADTVQPTEFVFYRVRLDWGQGLAYQLRVPEGPETSRTSVRIYLFNAQREQRGPWEAGGYDGAALKLPENSDAMATYPVRYLNREASGDPKHEAVAGWYYIAVHNAGGQEEDPAVPVTLDVAVVGEPEPGPEYAAASADGNAPVSDPFGGKSLGAASAPPTPDASATPEASGPPGASDATDTASGPFSLVSQRGPILWGAIAFAVLLIVALVLALTVSRRRTR